MIPDTFLSLHMSKAPLPLRCRLRVSRGMWQRGHQRRAGADKQGGTPVRWGSGQRGRTDMS